MVGAKFYADPPKDEIERIIRLAKYDERQLADHALAALQIEMLGQVCRRLDRQADALEAIAKHLTASREP